MNTNIPIDEFLADDPLAHAERALFGLIARERLGAFLRTFSSSQAIGALIPFVMERPWRYWDVETVLLALNVLERDIGRTFLAFAERNDALDLGIDGLFRPSPVVDIEKSLDLGKSSELYCIASQFLPEYLRWAEHVFGNLIEVYWSVAKKGGVQGAFTLPTARSLLKSKGLDRLMDGYDHSVRGAIAHGNVRFSGFEIMFGNPNPVGYSSGEFLRMFDKLCRTTNGLAVALILFWDRNQRFRASGSPNPKALVTRFAAGGLNRTGVELVGSVESTTPFAGRQLHVALRMASKSRREVLLNAGRAARYLIEAGANGYDRFVIEIDHGGPVMSQVIVLPPKLSALMQNGAPLARLPEAFDDGTLLWFDESRHLTRLRAWRTIISTHMRLASHNIRNEWSELGLTSRARYHIRDVQNQSVQGVARVEIRAVLANPMSSTERSCVRQAAYELSSVGRRRLVRSRRRFLDSGLPWPKIPQHVFVYLHRTDGTLRWLKSGGWLDGNLIAVAEFVSGGRKAVFVNNPEEVIGATRIRYSMDVQKAKDAIMQIHEMSAQIHQERGMSGA